MVNFLKALWAKMLCQHDWHYVDTVQDQDLRSGYKFNSLRYRCSKCEQWKTIENT